MSRSLSALLFDRGPAANTGKPDSLVLTAPVVPVVAVQEGDAGLLGTNPVLGEGLGRPSGHLRLLP